MVCRYEANVGAYHERQVFMAKMRPDRMTKSTILIFPLGIKSSSLAWPMSQER